MALSANQLCLRAYILQGEVYLKMGRLDQARQSWRTGIELMNDFCDISTGVELEANLSRLDSPVPTAPSEPGTQIFVGAQSPKATAISAPKPDVPPAPPTMKGAGTAAEPRDSESDAMGRASPSSLSGAAGGAGSSPASSKPKTGRVQAQQTRQTEEAITTARLQLALIRSHFIGEEGLSAAQAQARGDTRILPTVLASAKKSLSHASGEELVDDLIAVGYLLVNSGSLKEACELFGLLLKYRWEKLYCICSYR
jgi:hypothetical protein